MVILGIFIGIVGHAISEGQSKAIRKLKRGRQRKLLRVLFQSTRDTTRPSQRPNGFISDHATLLDDVKEVCLAELPEILVVMLLAYILGVREGWSFTSTMYFAVMSASTTGYGDYTPKTQADKLYCIFFLPLSVAVFGEVLGRIASIYIQRRVRQAEQKFLQRSITLCDLRKMDANHDGMVDMEEFLSCKLARQGNEPIELVSHRVARFLSYAGCTAKVREGHHRRHQNNLLLLGCQRQRQAR